MWTLGRHYTQKLIHATQNITFHLSDAPPPEYPCAGACSVLRRAGDIPIGSSLRDIGPKVKLDELCFSFTLSWFHNVVSVVEKYMVGFGLG
jgi:hypothetical protein